MTRSLFLLALGCSTLPGTPVGRARGEEMPRPNIVLILADDLGYGDVGCLNPRSKIPSPAVDRLAREGLLFTDAHSGSAVCSPTRYGLLTGRYAWRTRLKRHVLGPYDPPLIEKGRLTLPGLLRKEGYRTACVGKWHLGWEWPRKGEQVDFTRAIGEGPVTRGFDAYFGTDVPNYPPYCFIENNRTVGLPTGMKAVRDLDGRPGPMLPGWKFDEILPRLTERAVEVVGAQAKSGGPFFLYFALTSPHEPVAPSARLRGKSGISPLADFLMETDWAVGQVLAALDRHGLARDTLVIFTSDNGHATYTGLPVLQKHGHEPSGPLRGYKTHAWEGGHRVPFVARWPGRIRAGARSDETICLNDLLATCADLLGRPLPDDAGEDSFSILPALLGRKPSGPPREAMIHHSGGGMFAVRQGPWKLILGQGSGSQREVGRPPTPKEPAGQLYNLADDPGEQKNLYTSHPDVVGRLTALLEKYQREGRSRPRP